MHWWAGGEKKSNPFRCSARLHETDETSPAPKSQWFATLKKKAFELGKAIGGRLLAAVFSKHVLAVGCCSAASSDVSLQKGQAVSSPQSRKRGCSCHCPGQGCL